MSINHEYKNYWKIFRKIYFSLKFIKLIDFKNQKKKNVKIKINKNSMNGT